MEVVVGTTNEGNIFRFYSCLLNSITDRSKHRKVLNALLAKCNETIAFYEKQTPSSLLRLSETLSGHPLAPTPDNKTAREIAEEAEEENTTTTILFTENDFDDSVDEIDAGLEARSDGDTGRSEEHTLQVEKQQLQQVQTTPPLVKAQPVPCTDKAQQGDKV